MVSHVPTFVSLTVLSVVVGGEWSLSIVAILEILAAADSSWLHVEALRLVELAEISVVSQHRNILTRGECEKKEHLQHISFSKAELK